jgi:hypothetical protein
MRSATIFTWSTIQQQRLAYSFNTFTNTNTPFDAQKKRFGIITKSKSLPWRTCHLPTANQLHPDAS